MKLMNGLELKNLVLTYPSAVSSIIVVVSVTGTWGHEALANNTSTYAF